MKLNTLTHELTPELEEAVVSIFAALQLDNVGENLTLNNILASGSVLHYDEVELYLFEEDTTVRWHCETDGPKRRALCLPAGDSYKAYFLDMLQELELPESPYVYKLASTGTIWVIYVEGRPVAKFGRIPQIAERVYELVKEWQS